ncbi:MAG: nuclear transport factor 2 family protein [Acidimicrobiia bacterium]|nr:nuclear transport factor 2 family protein [Acidimicrobiia bacterium]
MSDPLQQLLDIEAIKQLKARYFRCMDTKDWSGFRDVFTDDAVLEAEGRVREGGENIAGFISKLLADVVTVHHGHMPEITLTGPDTATGVWAMFDYVEFPDHPEASFRGYGHYAEEYVRGDGGWRIRHLTLTRLRVDPLGGG